MITSYVDRESVVYPSEFWFTKFIYDGSFDSQLFIDGTNFSLCRLAAFALPVYKLDIYTQVRMNSTIHNKSF